MDKEKLREYLVNDRTRLYCVLDGASVPDLPKRLYETKAPNLCLFQGDLEPDMLYVAPYIVVLTSGNPFTETMFTQSWGKHWGIFLQSRHSLNAMHRHFRALINVYDENANAMIFRYYDPRVIRDFLPTCAPAELETFFGKAESFFAESADGNSLLKFELSGKKLKQTEMN